MLKRRPIRNRDPLAVELFDENEPLNVIADVVREQPESELRTRSLVLQPSTIDESTRSIGGILATEAIVSAFDVRRNQPVLETLRMEGVVLPPDGQVPLLDTHNATSVRHQFGSIRDFRIENGELHCRLYFSSTAEREWTMVKEGHLRSISAGYSPLETYSVPPGQTRTVLNRSYSAPANQPLFVTTRWPVSEGSLTAKGADTRAKLRSTSLPCEPTAMNPRLRAYLETIGLQANADEAAAVTFYRNLTGEQRTRADSLHSELPPPDSSATGAASAATASVVQRSEVTTTSPASVQVSANPAAAGGSATGSGNVATAIADSVRAEIAAGERQRIARINELAVGVAPELVTRAVNEGMDESRFAPLFLQSLRDQRAPAAGHGGSVAIHTRSHETDCNLAALQGALLIRQGCALDRAGFADVRFRSCDRLPTWIRLDINHAERQRAMELAHRFSGMSLPDMCREAVRLDGGRVTHNVDEMIRSAVSGSSLSAIFSTNINAELLAAYMEAPDSTRGWVDETDVANFLTHERAAVGKFGQLQKLARGGEADHLDTSDSKESSKIARYAGQFVIDEMDLIDDRFGAIEQLSPSEMGNLAAALRPDLIYSIIHANAALDADGVALFHSTHANIDTTALSATALEVGIAKMAKQRIRSRPLEVRARYLLVPHDLRFSSDVYLTSAQRFDGSSTGTAGGVKNPLAELGIIAVADDRLGTAGVTDPSTGTAYTGSATNWYLSARPRENGAKTLVCKYRRGTGRSPQIRSWVRTQGTFGLGWDIVHDIGADADDYRGLYEGNS